MENISDDTELLGKLSILYQKIGYNLKGAMYSYVKPTDEQRDRLLEQITNMIDISDRFSKNLLLLLDKE